MTPTQLMPTASDYVEALQHPAVSLTHPDLRSATFRSDFLGMPMAVSGASAIVFHATIGSQPRALRCFTARPSDAGARYRALDDHRRQHRLDELARAEWRDDAVTIRGRTLPVVVMDWVDGQPLDVHVARAAQHDPGSLAELAERWRRLVERLGAADVAHGDLQHGNVLVGPAGDLHLVDFDGLWLPAVATLVPHETGHPNYQHPDRARTQRWDRWIDAFAALSIYASLQAVAEEPRVVEQFGTGDNLVFTAADYQRPGETPCGTRWPA